MARRNREERINLVVVKLVGLMMALALLGFAPAKVFVSRSGTTVLIAVGLAILPLATLLVWLALMRRRESAAPDPEPSPPPETWVWDNYKPSPPPESVPRLNRDALPVSGHSTLNQAPFSDQLHSIDWFQFEKIVGVLYEKQGYAVTRRGGAKADGGIDLIVEKAGERFAVQCKHWQTWTVRVRSIREFIGAMTVGGFKKGIFVAVGTYTEDARQLASEHGIETVDHARLLKMLESADARFDPKITALLHDKRKFCPKCEAEMVLRTATKGRNAGGQFWGCSHYPRCKRVIQFDDQATAVVGHC